MEKELEFAKTLAREGGAIMRQYFNGDQQVEIKEDHSPVTVADKLVNSHIIQRILETYPDHGVVGEEQSTESEDQEKVWFCDPIDGTKAFIWGSPTAAFSLALVIKGRPVLGVAYNPFVDLMYSASEGQGAFRNDQRLKVSNHDLHSGVLGSSADQPQVFGPRYQKINSMGIELAFFSGFVYKGCLTADGRLVGIMENGVNRHDIAAVDLIVHEAGGRVTDFSNNPLDYSQAFKGAVVSNGVVHDQLLEIAQTA